MVLICGASFELDGGRQKDSVAWEPMISYKRGYYYNIVRRIGQGWLLGPPIFVEQRTAPPPQEGGRRSAVQWKNGNNDETSIFGKNGGVGLSLTGEGRLTVVSFPGRHRGHSSPRGVTDGTPTFRLHSWWRIDPRQGDGAGFFMDRSGIPSKKRKWLEKTKNGLGPTRVVPRLSGLERGPARSAGARHPPASTAVFEQNTALPQRNTAGRGGDHP